MTWATCYWVEVWRIPPGKDRYRDAHESHRERGLECGTVETIGKVRQLGREYKTLKGAERYAAKLREQWGERFYVEITSGGKLTW
jgi:hypothetical protein